MIQYTSSLHGPRIRARNTSPTILLSICFYPRMLVRVVSRLWVARASIQLHCRLSQDYTNQTTSLLLAGTLPRTRNFIADYKASDRASNHLSWKTSNFSTIDTRYFGLCVLTVLIIRLWNTYPPDGRSGFWQLQLPTSTTVFGRFPIHEHHPTLEW